MTNKRRGNTGENVAASAMRLAGIRQVQKIATPHVRTNRPPYIVYSDKVAGDHHGILPSGIGVLAESKTISGDKLNYSELQKHQHAALDAWAENNGLALVVWVSDYGVWIMEYTELLAIGFAFRSSLSISQAKAVSAKTELIIERLCRVKKKK